MRPQANRGVLRIMGEYLSKKAILTGISVENWEEAVEKAGGLLVSSGKAKPSYIQAVINIVKQNGAYIVVAPGLAITHARPEDGAIKTGLSFLKLKTPVIFPGREDNPVTHLISLSAISKDDHLDLLSFISDMLGNSERLEKLKAYDVPEDIYNFFILK